MIRLTYVNSERHVFVAPERITAVLPPLQEGVGTIVRVDDPGVDYYCVSETPLDIARLRAAWECRYTAKELRKELPIAVYFDAEAPAIQFMCCQVTHDLRVKREKKKQERKLPESIRGKLERIRNA